MTDGFTLFLSQQGVRIAPSPDALRAMNAEELSAYERAQGDPTNVPWELRVQAAAMSNFIRPRKPTMTLAEYDARRAAFRPTA